jgi:hypothetical protein
MHSPPSQVSAPGNLKRFKDHYIGRGRTRGASPKEMLGQHLGKNYPKWKVDRGAQFLADLTNLIRSGQLVYVSRGTLYKGQPWGHIFRGQGMTLVLRQNGEFWTLLQSGIGRDTAIQMIP